jgi:hypothetical protein
LLLLSLPHLPIALLLIVQRWRIRQPSALHPAVNDVECLQSMTTPTQHQEQESHCLFALLLVVSLSPKISPSISSFGKSKGGLMTRERTTLQTGH